MGIGGSRQMVSTGLKKCTLWKSNRSPASRAVMMALDAMNLSMTEVEVNFDKEEHKAPEILAMNKLGTLPILKDRKLVLHDSHAICSYLASRYCDSGNLLPKDPGGLALVNQQLHYNNGILYPRYRAAAYPILYEKCNAIMPPLMSEIQCTYADMENMLASRNWFGGGWPSLGDIAFASTVSTLNVLVPIDKQRFPRLSSWLFRISEESFYITGNKKGLEEFSKRLDRGYVYGDTETKCPCSSSTRRSMAESSENKVPSV